MNEVPSERLPLERLYHWEETRPHDIYLSQPMGNSVGRDYTWAETVDEVRRMAAYLKSFDWPPGTHIAIISKNCAHWLMSDYAIWMAGHVSVPLYPTLTADTVRQILEHSECKACFVGKLDGWETMKPGLPSGIHCISYPLSPRNDYDTWDDIVRTSDPISDHPTRPANDLATIIYTSGTTGQPKGVMQSFGAFAWSVATVVDRMAIGVNDRVLSYLPLAHVAERAIVEFGSLAVGFRIFFAESIETFQDDLRSARPTIFFSVPRLWKKFQQDVFKEVPPKRLDLLLKIPIVNRLVSKKIQKALGLDECRYAAGGAAAMPGELLHWYKRLGLEILEAYGMTENCAISHANQPGCTKPGYVGFAYDGVETRIAPDTGEMEMRSPGLMMGYYKAPDLTRAAMTQDGWLRTGDKGEFDDEGRFRITGRAKDIFKTSKGKYVSPGPIEGRLIDHPGLEACCVVGADFPQPFGLVMLAQRVADGAQSATSRDQLTGSLREHLDQLNAALDAHERLEFLVVVDEPWSIENGLLTPTLKLKRNEIEELYSPHFASWRDNRKPVVWQSSG